MVAGTLLLMTGAALTTYRQATAPAQTVRLDVATVEAAPALAGAAKQLREDVFREIGSLKNSSKVALSLELPSRASQATHRLFSGLSPKDGKLSLHAIVQDLHSGAPVIEWSGNYAPAQLHYAPVALASLVSRAFQLPAPARYATVNATAAPAYQHGLALLADDSKIDQALMAFHSAAGLDPDSALPFAALAEANAGSSSSPVMIPGWNRPRRLWSRPKSATPIAPRSIASRG